MGAQGLTPPQNVATPSAAANRLPSRTDSPTNAFRMLDAANRGYVTRADVDQIPGFVGFDSADANRDGILTPEEFATAWKLYSSQ
jgi:Ca2+-binding EF-hand superfamily protein